MSSTKFDPTKPVRTRDGRKARIIVTDRVGSFPLRPIVALVSVRDGDDADEYVYSYGLDGYSESAGVPSGSDLINVGQKAQVTYYNIYKGRSGNLYVGAPYNSASDAQVTSTYMESPVGRVRVELTEGKFDE